MSTQSRRATPLALLAVLLSASAAWAAQETVEEKEASRSHLRALSIEELMAIPVTTPGRKEQPAELVPAALTVLRGEDLRRMGIRSIPDALRYVPGAEVVQQDASTWGVSIRGFNGRFANKLQVLMDGRSVYTPIFSGVFWEQIDPMLEDVDRIEIVRGPGASVWGANAVNGVINIITKKSTDTAGGLVAGGGGSQETVFGEARWGAAVSDDAHFRVFAKSFRRDGFVDGQDDWGQDRAGFRADWSPTTQDQLVLTGEYYDATAHHERTAAYLTAPTSRTFIDHEDFSGGHLAGWWERSLDGAGSLRVQMNYEFSHRDRDTSEQQVQVAEIDATHRFRLLDWNDVTWGLGYRGSWDKIEDTFQLSYDPSHAHRDLASAFVQDEIRIVRDTLWVTLGSKFEYNTSTHFEIQPTARLTLAPAEGHVFWAAVSRAVRTPSRTDNDHRVNAAVFGGPTVLAVFGSKDLDSETMTAYEIGYRMRPAECVSIDATAFYNRYDDLLTAPAGTPFAEADPAPAHTVMPVVFRNGIAGCTRGVEVEVLVDPVKGWRLRGNYSFIRGNFHESNGNPPATDDEGLEANPRHRASLWSSMDLPGNFEFDAGARFVDKTRRPELKSWTEMDARVAWRGIPKLEIGIVGRSLLHDQHRETAALQSGGITITEVQRAIWAYVEFRF